MVCPDDAWTGPAPHSAANDFSERIRSGLSPAAAGSAEAVSGPTPLAANSAGLAPRKTTYVGFELVDLRVEGLVAAGQVAQRLLPRKRWWSVLGRGRQTGTNPHPGP